MEERTAAAQAGAPAAEGRAGAAPAGAFEWQRTSARRTVFTVDYWPGIPATDKEGWPGHGSDLGTGSWLREASGEREINGIDFTSLKDCAIDMVSWSHNWNGHWNGRDPDGFGQLNVTGGLLRGSGKMIGLTEPHVRRYGGGQWCVFRPDELLHFIYRGL